MELRQLEYFMAVCQSRSFTKASERLHVAQPSITKSIQQLEEEIGVSLFDRSQKPIALTNAGEFFSNRISTIMKELQQAQLETRALFKLQKEVVRIDIPPMIGTKMIPFLIADNWEYKILSLNNSINETDKSKGDNSETKTIMEDNR